MSILETIVLQNELDSYDSKLNLKGRLFFVVEGTVIPGMNQISSVRNSATLTYLN